MYAVIIKESQNKYIVMDVYFKGIWEFDEKYLIDYLSLLNSRNLENHQFTTLVSSKDKKDVIEFVRRERMPVLCNFDADYIASQLSKFDEGIITPPTPIIEVTPFCNYNCSWCYVPTRDNRQSFITLEEFKDRIVKPMVSKFGLVEWCITGGEPSLDKNRTESFAKIINSVTKEILNKRPQRIYLLTNGYNLEKNAESFYLAGINCYQVALTSPFPYKEISLRHPPKNVNSFEHAVNGLRKLKSLGARTEINMIIQPRNSKPCSNIDDIEKMFELAHDLHINMLRIIPAVPSGKAFENGILFTREEYNNIGETVQKMRAFVEHDMIVDCPIDQPIESDRSVFCRAATLWLYVNYKRQFGIS